MNSILSRRGGRAFTLVELLVVIAIVALLIAILVPTLSSARVAAKRSATQSLLTDVSRASESFALDNRRVPGMIPDSVLYAQNSSAPREFTAMDNAMLELAGGGIRAIDGDNPLLDTVDDDFPIHVDSTTGTEYHASPTLVGEGDYLQIEGGNLQVMNNDDERRRLVPDPYQSRNMPTFVDNFGTPILYFRRSGARFSPPTEGNFELVGNLIGGGYDGSTWYWWDAAHAYGFTGAPLQDPGEYSDPNQGGSWLFYDGDSLSESESSAYKAVLEHPSMYEDAPRGDFVVISAGPDGVYFNRDQYADIGEDLVGRHEVYWNADGNPSDTELDEVPDLETTFNDLIVAGGG
jgi:prepilin-type N-terminal cleavage/methylation domain-containing protein